MFSARTPHIFLLIFALAAALTVTAGCEDREPRDVSFALSLEGGELVSHESPLTVNHRDTVTLEWTSDVPLLVHLHGYDIELALQPGVTEPMTFIADATGRYTITVHSSDAVHVHGSGEACRVSVPQGEPQPAVTIAAAESRMGGNVFIEVDVENFEIEPGGGHWHLTMDGVDYGMYSRSDVTLAVEGTGERVFEATLADANHCLYDASDSETVLIEAGMSMDDTDTDMTGHDMDDMDTDMDIMDDDMTDDDMTGHDMDTMTDDPTAAGIPERVVATLEVRP